MLKKNVNEFNQSVFNELNKWPILTCGDKTTGFNSMTVSWGGFGTLWNKQVCFIFVRKSRYTYEFINKSDSVTLSFLSDEYKRAKEIFGKKSGRDVNKYLETNLHPCFEPDFNGYFIAEALYAFKMKKLYSIDLPIENLPDSIKNAYYPNDDIHTMFVCEIKEYLVKENLYE